VRVRFEMQVVLGHSVYSSVLWRRVHTNMRGRRTYDYCLYFNYVIYILKSGVVAAHYFHRDYAKDRWNVR
jgi:hypothetical protein